MSEGSLAGGRRDPAAAAEVRAWRGLPDRPAHASRFVSSESAEHVHGETHPDDAAGGPADGSPGGKAHPVILRSEATKDLPWLRGRADPFAALRACPELEGKNRSDGGRSFAPLRMTGKESEGMTRKEK